MTNHLDRCGVVVAMAMVAGSCAPSSDLPPEGGGTVRISEEGQVTGTGWRYYHYDAARSRVKAKDAYREGKLVYSAWFKPDGTLVGEERWVEGNGVQLYLRDDGSIEKKVPMRRWKAEGTATYYRADGTTEKTVEYRDGKTISK